MRRKKKTLGHSLDSGTVVVNREYDELEKNGKLARVLKLRHERLKLMAEWRAVWAEITRCGTYEWADRFALRMLRNRQKVYSNLQRHFDSLDDRKNRLLTRLKEITNELVELGGSIVSPEPSADEVSSSASLFFKDNSRQKVFTPARYRDQAIRQYSNLSNEKLCARLDFELGWMNPPVGFPRSWLKYGVRTFSDAYKNAACKNLVQKMIADAKQEL
jgi:hypothetical protein